MSTYEELRDNASGEGGDAWREADRLTGNLYGVYREPKADPRYSEEHKAERAWERYEAARGKIEAGKARARELLEKQARSAERFSIPVPAEESVTTTDTAKLLASQNEASRVVRKIDRMDGNAKGPFKPDRMEVLRAEHAERLTSLIGGKVPEPSFARPGERKRVPGRYGAGSGALLLLGRGTPAPDTASRGKRRRAPWK